MEELGTAVTSADVFCKGNQGEEAWRLSSKVVFHGHLHQGSSISPHTEQPPLVRAVCRLATHPGISHPPSQLHKALLIWQR